MLCRNHEKVLEATLPPSRTIEIPHEELNDKWKEGELDENCMILYA